MKTDYCLHFIWLLAFCWLAYLISECPTKVRTTDTIHPVEYKIVGTMKVTTDPYLVVPVYVAAKDVRSWYYMREADKVVRTAQKMISVSKGEPSALPQ